MKFLHITEAGYLGGHRIWIKFDDGTEGQVNLFDELDGPVFEPLKDPSYFARFTLQGNTLTWPNGADFAPEYLHALTLRGRVA